jgi:hypothetical protein
LQLSTDIQLCLTSHGILPQCSHPRAFSLNQIYYPIQQILTFVSFSAWWGRFKEHNFSATCSLQLGIRYGLQRNTKRFKRNTKAPNIYIGKKCQLSVGFSPKTILASRRENVKMCESPFKAMHAFKAIMLAL